MASKATAGSDLASFDPSRPDAAAQISGLLMAIILIDRSGHVFEANQAAENLLGCSSKRLIGRELGEIIGPLDDRVAERLRDPDSALVARDIVIASGTVASGIIASGDGTRRVDLTISPINSHPDWRVVSLCETGHHETGSDDGSVAIGAPAILAHEIKNPLAAIRGAGQLAARKLPAKDRSLGTMIVDEVDRIARLIDRMQQLGSQTRNEQAPCNPHLAIRSAIATLRTARGGDVSIQEEFDPSLPPALANRDALEQVLVNLIANALDAAGSKDDGIVSIRTRFVSGRAFSAIRFGRAVKLPLEITVTDNGPGIAEELGERIFEPFVTSKPSGQGLGLALVRKLVRDMDGTVSYERDARQGLTHFRVYLPMAATKRK